MNVIEEKLWNFIDGSCSPEEYANISELIERDEAYRQKYHELLILNKEFAAVELDEPPMAFAYKVMETIRTENASKPLKAAIDKRIIWGIAGFFTLTLTALLVFTILNINWSAGATDVATPLSFTMPKIQNYISSNIIEGFIFVDIIMGLFLLDGYLRRKLINGQPR